MKEQPRMKTRAKAYRNRANTCKEQEILRDFRDYVREYLYYHLEEEDYWTVVRSHAYRRWMRELDAKQVSNAWLRGDYCIDLIHQVFCQNPAFDEDLGIDIWLDATRKQGRWEAYLERIAPRALKKAKATPWEGGHAESFWPWREKLAWLHRKKKGTVVRDIETKGWMRKKLYKITLADRCQPAWADMPLLLFTDDIDNFQRRWASLEKAFWWMQYGLDYYEKVEDNEGILRLKAKVSRRATRKFQKMIKQFCRSKAGKKVCFYYNKPEYNIVQIAAATIYAEKTFVVEDAWFTHTSLCDYWNHFHVDRWTIRFRWILFRGAYFRTASYLAEGVCQFDLEPKRLWQVENNGGNAIYEISSPYAPDNGTLSQDETPMRNSSFQDFAGNTVATIADMDAKRYENERELLADAESFAITEKIMADLFGDMAGV